MYPIRYNIVSNFWMDNFYENDKDCQMILKYGPLAEMDDETKHTMYRQIQRASEALVPRTLFALILRFSSDETYRKITEKVNAKFAVTHPPVSDNRVAQMIEKGVYQLLRSLRQVLKEDGVLEKTDSVMILRLPQRAYTSFRRHHIDTIEQLINVPYGMLRTFNGVGVSTAALIIEALRKVEPDCQPVREYDRLRAEVINAKMPAVRCIFTGESPFTVIVSGETEDICYENIAKIESPLGERDKSQDIVGFVNDKGKFTLKGSNTRV